MILVSFLFFAKVRTFIGKISKENGRNYFKDLLSLENIFTGLGNKMK